MKKANRPSTYPGYELPADCDYPLIKSAEQKVKVGREYKGSILIETDSTVLCRVFLHDFNTDEEAKNTAKAIGDSLNNYQSLKDSNAELLEALKDVLAELQCYTWSKETKPVYDRALQIIEKAKAL